MDVIKELKENLARYETMPTRLTDEMSKIGRDNFRMLSNNGEWRKGSMITTFATGIHYHLRPDYEAKTEYVDRKIEQKYDSTVGAYVKKFNHPVFGWMPLDFAARFGAAGYRFLGGMVRAYSVVYKDKGGFYYYALCEGETLANFEVVHATAVVFKK